MSSLIMHIVASKMIQEKYNLSDKFMAGCIMPDIYTKCGIDRNKSHYIDSSNINTPNILNYINENLNQIDDEMVLGYLVHLIEDKIWFSKFVNKYAKTVCTDSKDIKYLMDGSIEGSIEFYNTIYEDYNYIDNYICRKYSISMNDFKNSIIKYFSNDKEKKFINESLCLHEYDTNRKNVFITHEDAEKYIRLSSKEAEKIITQYI